MVCLMVMVLLWVNHVRVVQERRVQAHMFVVTGGTTSTCN